MSNRRFIPEPRLLDSPVDRPLPSPYDGEPARTSEVPGRARLVVIGTGVHGVCLGAHLWHGGMLVDTVLLDAEERPLDAFEHRVRSVHQRVLRSPYEHHVGAENHGDCDMLEFARAHWRYLTSTERDEIRMAQSGQRSVVPLDVFMAHARHVVSIHDLGSRRWRTSVREVEWLGPRRLLVHHARGRIEAEAVVWATGEEVRPVPADWTDHAAPPDPGSLWRLGDTLEVYDSPSVVIGAGLTAAHVVWWLRRHGAPVTWIMRGAERYQCSDVDARYFRPEGRARFARCPRERRVDLLGEQRRASIMFEFRPALRAWEEEGSLRVLRHTPVRRIAGRDGGGVTVDVGPGQPSCGPFASVYLALGLSTALTPSLTGCSIESWYGRPVLADETLEVRGASGAFATGPLAALSVGPASRNVDGARIAAQRIVACLAERWR
jgi:hypothetical protein